MKYNVWAECKNCVHFPEDHQGDSCVGLVIVKSVNNKLIFYPEEKCGCKKHIPLDNLHYIEWKYENSFNW